MISDGAIKAFVTVIAKCEAGVDYVSGTGAICPGCGTPLATTTTRDAQDGLRVRYHKCACAGCIVRTLGLTIKSIEKVG